MEGQGQRVQYGGRAPIEATFLHAPRDMQEGLRPMEGLRQPPMELPRELRQPPMELPRELRQPPRDPDGGQGQR